MVTDPVIGMLLGFFAGYMIKDQLGKGILGKSKFFVEGFALIILIALLYVLYMFGVFQPIIDYLGGN